MGGVAERLKATRRNGGYAGNRIEGSNPSPSATLQMISGNANQIAAGAFSSSRGVV